MRYVETRRYDLAPAARESSYSATFMLNASMMCPPGAMCPCTNFEELDDALCGLKAV